MKTMRTIAMYNSHISTGTEWKAPCRLAIVYYCLSVAGGTGGGAADVFGAILSTQSDVATLVDGASDTVLAQVSCPVNNSTPGVANTVNGTCYREVKPGQSVWLHLDVPANGNTACMAQFTYVEL